jgi:hypothetical protein
MARVSEGWEGIAGQEAYTVKIINIISHRQ